MAMRPCRLTPSALSSLSFRTVCLPTKREQGIWVLDVSGSYKLQLYTNLSVKRKFMENDLFNRRKFLITGSALATMPAFGLMAQEEKAVFRGWTVSQLNDQLNQGPYLPSPPELKKIADSYTTNSAKVRAQYPPKTFSYGSSDAEKLDVFAPAYASGLPVMIFFHGGSWDFDNKNNYSMDLCNQYAIDAELGHRACRKPSECHAF